MPCLAQNDTLDVSAYDTVSAPPVEETSDVVDEEENEEENEYFLPAYITPASHEIRKFPDNYITDLKKSDDFWYADQAPAPKKKEAPVRKGWLAGAGVQNILLVITILVFVVLLGLLLSNSNINFFRKTKKIREDADPDIISEDIFQINYDRDIQHAINNQLYRPAVRLMYLRLLKQLADRGLISYHKDQTNADYLQQLSRGPYYKDFFRLTREYEYSWYGLFQIDRPTFDVIQRDFDSFTSSITAR